MKGDWNSINWPEFWSAVGMSTFVGLTRLLYLIRRGRKFVWFDVILEPMLAIIGGLLCWAIGEVTSIPDVVQACLTSLGAWGGPKTIRRFELKHLGGTRSGDRDTTGAMPLGD